MKLNAIIEEVQRLVDDTSYDPITIEGKINLALTECFHEVDIPDFKKVTNVELSTSLAYVNLESKISNFGGRVKRAKYDGADLHTYSSLDDMLIDYDDLETVGDLEAVCIEGRFLWYVKLPETAPTILVLYYEHPEPLSQSNKELTWMPEHVQYKVLVGGTCAKIFDEIEEEDSGKPVARRYEKMFEEGLTAYRSWISKNRPNLTYSCWGI